MSNLPTRIPGFVQKKSYKLGIKPQDALFTIYPVTSATEQRHASITDPNYWFHYCFTNRWNSGINSRNYENFARDVRAALGYSTNNRTIRVRVDDQEEALSAILKYNEEQDVQLVFSNATMLWGLKLVDGVPVYYCEYRIGTGEIVITYEGDYDEVFDNLEAISGLFSQEVSVHVFNVSVAPDGSIVTNGHFFSPKKVNLGDELYYSWLDTFGENNTPMTLDELAVSYRRSSSNVLMFYGPRGTGKSTLARTLMVKMPDIEHIYLVTDELTTTTPSFRVWLESLPPKTLIVVEDANNLTRSREDGNQTMITLLNVSDGVIPKDIKLLISSNLDDLDDVDTALKRTGRLYGAAKFTVLPEDRVNKVRELHGMAPLAEEHIKKGLTLADTLNWENANRGYTEKGFGFARHM